MVAVQLARVNTGDGPPGRLDFDRAVIKVCGFRQGKVVRDVLIFQLVGLRFEQHLERLPIYRKKQIVLKDLTGLIQVIEQCVVGAGGW